jgi:hypothetical protein
LHINPTRVVVVLADPLKTIHVVYDECSPSNATSLSLASRLELSRQIVVVVLVTLLSVVKMRAPQNPITDH